MTDKDKPMKIKIADKTELGRVGHQEHQSGTGAHTDKRKRRQRTRSDASRKAIKDSEG